MTQEDKLLLLKDLCARLPYGVKVEHLLHAPNNPSDLFAIDVDKQVLYCDHKGREEWYKVDFVKPYLRPMSSMTEEEKKELSKRYVWEINGSEIKIKYHSDGYWDDDIYCPTEEYLWLFDWLLKNHFDYRGLIPKELAIAVTEQNNPYK